MKKPYSIPVLLIAVLAGMMAGCNPSEVKGWSSAESGKPCEVGIVVPPCLATDGGSEWEHEEAWLAANRCFQMEANACLLALVLSSVGAAVCVALICSACAIWDRIPRSTYHVRSHHRKMEGGQQSWQVLPRSSRTSALKSASGLCSLPEQ
jgi:hypothetical protein